MKLYIKKITLFTLFMSLTVFNGCDELNNLPLNIPIKFSFSKTGSNTTINENQSVWLSSVQDWRDNQENINSASFISAAYWTIKPTSEGLQGDVNVSLSDESGKLLFSINIPNYKAADNLDKPYTLKLNQNQIQAMDDYLSLIGKDGNDHSFTASLTVSNITGASSPYTISGKVEVVLQADIDL